MKLIGVCLLLLISFRSTSQNELGTRLLVYPAGKITTIQYGSSSETGWTWTAEAGYNFARRQGFGLHDNEEGGGPGLGLGLRKYFTKPNSGFYAEANNQLWFMEINWMDNFDCPPNADCIPNVGRTRISVLQPTLGAGYAFRSKSEKWAALIGLAFGQEFNIKTKGDAVGEGGISLLTFSITRRL
jgi:hypothetical protein